MNTSTPLLAYFDHNHLNHLIEMEEESQEQFFSTLQDKGLTPVYSDENLREIAGSVQRIEAFLTLLSKFGFHRIYEELVDFKPTDQILMSNEDPRIRYEELQKSAIEYPAELDATSFVRKIFGGEVNDSSFDLLSNGLATAEEEMRKLYEEIGDALPIEERKKIEAQLASLPESKALLESQKDSLNEGDSGEKPVIIKAQQEGGYENALNEIMGPNILSQIWDVIGPTYGAPERSMEDFFDTDTNRFSPHYRFSNSIPTRVSSIYNQLNFVGYWRDKKMKKEREFNGAQSDAKHVGIASVCQLFFSDDDRLIKKAHAAFEHVGSGCKIIRSG